MAKAKQRQLVVIPATINTPSDLNVDLPGEDSWVMVKKQKVTILISPLSVTTNSTVPNPGPSQLQEKPRKTIDTQSQCPNVRSPQMHSVCERERSMLEKARKPSSFLPISPSPKRSRPDHMKRLKNPRLDSFKCRKTFGICSASKVSKRSTRFVDGVVQLNQRMRASNLERKLQRAGGLRNWLVSMGLDQFVKIFQEKSVNKFQLVNLNMKKLKDMGADAVGPRRKLMHAINCLCQPYCFEDSQVLWDVRGIGK